VDWSDFTYVKPFNLVNKFNLERFIKNCTSLPNMMTAIYTQSKLTVHIWMFGCKISVNSFIMHRRK
jgi:hypothetical protein